jgi:hypothetical protein
MVSFDLGEHSTVLAGKRYIDREFPGRHELLLGNSVVSVPLYLQTHPGAVFDVLYIDGGHKFEVASHDIQTCAHLAHKDSVVVVDDVVVEAKYDFCRDPSRAWELAKNCGLVREVGRRVYAKGCRGMVWGHYLKREIRVETGGDEEAEKVSEAEAALVRILLEADPVVRILEEARDAIPRLVSEGDRKSVV